MVDKAPGERGNAQVPDFTSGTGAPGYEIEITPQMIEAGEIAFERFFGYYPSYLLVKEIYIAMDALRGASQQGEADERLE
jgi:hypothetical protein